MPERNVFFAPKEGDIITFGRYPQNSGIPEPIEWRVLSIDGDLALAISKYALDRVEYNKEHEKVTWKSCTLRSWLNGKFMNAAFSPDEQQMIQRVALSNPSNPVHGTPGSEETYDRIFCLSTDEADRYFFGNEERACKPTMKAELEGAETDCTGYCWWWLRSPGDRCSNAALVHCDGKIYYGGGNVHDDEVCVRPALYIKL